MILERVKCVLTGWECVGTSTELKTDVNLKIIKILEQNSHKKFHYLAKEVSEGSVKSFTVFAKGSTYLYKALVPSSMWIDNQGHGGFIQNGPMVIYRKKRKRD